jgi:hypothetical protein
MRLARKAVRSMVVGAALLGALGYGGNVQISSITFSLGSLIASGVVTGLGSTNYVLTLDAIGEAEVLCSSKGGATAPGQNPSVFASTGSTLVGEDSITKNGRANFSTRAPGAGGGTVAYPQNGCPNKNWSGNYTGFVYWTSATVTITDPATNTIVFRQTYACTTTRNPDSVTCY